METRSTVRPRLEPVMALRRKMEFRRATLFCSLVVASVVNGCGSSGSGGTGGTSGTAGHGGTGGVVGSGGAAGMGADPGCQIVLNPAGSDTGLESCTDGTLRRRAAVSCAVALTAADAGCAADCESPAYCATLTDQHSPKLYCVNCSCASGCLKDADCGPGSICECGTDFGTCIPAHCTTNAECGAGFACVATAQGVSGGACNQTSDAMYPPITLFVCQTAADSCRGQADCADAGVADDAGANEIDSPACLFDGTRRACGEFCAYPP